MPITNLADSISYSDFPDRIALLSEPHGLKGEIFGNSPPRSLSTGEIVVLKAQGNYSNDWGRISVHRDFSPEHIWHNRFIGHVSLGVFDGQTIAQESEPCSLVRSGIWRSSIENSHLASGCAISDSPQIYNSAILASAAVVSSHISAKPGKHGLLYGNGTRIPVGIETGGRELAFFADISLELAEYLLSHPKNEPIQQAYEALLKSYLRKVTGALTIVDRGAMVFSVKRLIDSYIGPGALLCGADEVNNSCIISSPQDPVRITNGSVVRDSCIQEGVEISDTAIIQQAMLFEHSHASHHGKIVDSIIGPNSGVSKGEITSCFLGPFVGFHHQSMLIAAFWPGGRGNVGYGANVGSNHTSRVPDQECWPGEGMFFGLGCAVKYPANFRQAPYSIIAAGVTTLPQKMDFPFSLINEPVAYIPEIPPGYNNLIPAWGLSNNMYALMRNEQKYLQRNKARRNTFDLRLFRPDICTYMRDAVERLEAISQVKEIYLPSDIEGLGKNVLTEQNRLVAIEAYRFFLIFVERRNLWLELSAKLDLGASITQASSDLAIPIREIRAYLEEYLNMLPRIIHGTENARQRDIDRGSAIIPDYVQTHPSLDEDIFVLQVRKETQEQAQRIQGLLERL